MSLDDRLARLEHLLTPPPGGFHILPLYAQAETALILVRDLRAALAAQRQAAQ